MNPKMYLYKRIVDAKLYIDTHYQERIDLNGVSGHAHFSKYHFLRLFKNAFGKSPHQYLIEVRLEAAKKLLKENHPVSETCTLVGFESIPSFCTLFKKKEQKSPHEYRLYYQQLKRKQEQSPFSFVPNCFAENFDRNK